MNSSFVWKRLARLDDDPTFREIERAQPSFRREGSKGDFYFLLCDPTDGRYLSTGPASCEIRFAATTVYTLFIFAIFPSPPPFLFRFISSFYLIEPTRTKIKSPRKAPDFPPPRVCLQICNCWKTCGNDGKIGTGARAEHVNLSTCRGVAISLLRIRITLP